MRGLRISLPEDDDTLRVLCLGAHADDIEIGCGGSLLEWLAAGRAVELRWAVFSAPGERRREAQSSAEAFTAGARGVDIRIADFRESFFPDQWREIKEHCEKLREGFEADVVFTHRRSDRHQDHRTLAELAWNTWRDHLILQFEIPKYEGDLGAMNAYQPLAAESAARKSSTLRAHFPSQAGRGWFDEELFRGLMRLRGVECNSASCFAEAFEASKLVLTPS